MNSNADAAPRRAEDVRDIIKAAFPDAPPPRNVLARNANYLEVRELANEFSGKRWQDLDDDFVLEHYDVLPLLSPAGFQYYLPAFMLRAIEYDTYGLVGPNTVGILSPPLTTAAADMEDFLDRIRPFSSQQGEAIRVFLEYLHYRHPDESLPALALSGYWAKGER